MQEQLSILRKTAQQKMESGSLMKIAEVAALLDVTASTVHKLPLPSIRVGQSLRFDPMDVLRLIEAGKEPVIV